MKIFSEKKAIELTIKTVITITLMVLILIIMFPNLLNLGKSGRTGAISLSLKQDIFECEQFGKCEIKNCDDKNIECNDNEKKKWDSLVEYSKECDILDKEGNKIECDTLQKKTLELLKINNFEFKSEFIKKAIEDPFFQRNKEKFETYAKEKGIDVNLLYSIIIKENAYNKKFEESVRFECHKFNAKSDIDLKCTLKNGKSFSTEPSETNYQAYLNAKKINPELAFQTSSFGFAQIMGSNYINLGLNIDYEEGLEKLKDENLQIEYFFKFLEKNNLIDNLKDKNWQKIAENYNGKFYAQNNYDIDLKKIYENIS